MKTKTDKPFGQEVQLVQVLLALLEVPEKHKHTIIWPVIIDELKIVMRHDAEGRGSQISQDLLCLL